MKVKEFIEELKKFDGERQLCIEDREEDVYYKYKFVVRDYDDYNDPEIVVVLGT